MSVTVDPRFAARRQSVREQGARRRLRWVVLTLGVLLGGAGIVWLLQSPLLDVDRVHIDGGRHADVAGILAGIGIRPEQPMVAIRTGDAERVLEASPWIKSADVDVNWPSTIRVRVVEHRPVAWVGGEGGWALTASDGAVVARAEHPTPGEASIALPVAAEPGGRVDDALVLGALEFIAALPADLAVGVEVTEGSRGLVAQVAGHQVRLGGADRPRDKAVVSAGLIADGLPPGSSLDVSAPNRPAVIEPTPDGATDAGGGDPDPQVEGESSSG